MATDRAARVIGPVRGALLRGDGCAPTDGQLLTAFLGHRDEAAFEALVRRHGPMVLGVCRRVVGHADDADDAFQATFLVLARRAASVVPREAVGNWLYGVAVRTASKARAAALRRRTRERQVADLPHPPAPAADEANDLAQVIDRELSRLPDKYRLPVVLCDLEGRPRRAVARELGVPDGTLSNRLAAARRVLARRLGGRDLFAVGAGTVLTTGATACVPPALLTTTLTAAARGQSVPPRVAALMTGDPRPMTRITLGLAAGTLIAVAVAALAQPGAPPPPPLKAPAVPPAAAPAKAKRFPVWVNAKAFVTRNGDKDEIVMRAEIPSGRFLKLTDADGKPVHIHEFVSYQPPPFTVELKDVKAYDTRGRARKATDWLAGLKEETLVLLEFRGDGDVSADQLAEAYQLFREDLVVLILPTEVLKQVDTAKAFAPAKSLPQAFPGSVPVPGGPVPPKSVGM
jgi:RNA polymerase sigma factor (sigma-70 family)